VLRANPQGTRIEFPSSAIINVRRSHREHAGLRGPVRTNLEEVIVPFGKKRLIVTEYTPDGKVLTARRGGADAPEWISTNTYDPDGRLVKSSSGAPGKPQFIVMRTYDEKGRLKTVTHEPAQSGQFEIYYNEKGLKNTIRTFDFEVPLPERSTLGHSPWDDAASGFGVPKGGNVTTAYDEHDQATELQVRGAEGNIICRVVRVYDADGQITEEKPISENPASRLLDTFPEDQRSQLSPDQIKGMNNSIGRLLAGKHPVGTFYRYDAKGRLTEIRECNFVFKKTTTIIYNDQDDKAEEQTTFTDNHAMPLVPYTMQENGTLMPSEPTAKPARGMPLPEDSYAHYAYEYDRHGNWIQQTMTVPSHPDLPPTTLHRTLSYYD
jgi:hypothetical protein